MEKELIEYIVKNKKFTFIYIDGLLTRIPHKKREKTGILLCEIMDSNFNKVVLGFSLCNYRDEFDKNMGFNIAKERAYKWQNKNIPPKIPNSIKKQLLKFIERSKRYYKDKKFPEWVNFI